MGPERAGQPLHAGRGEEERDTVFEGAHSSTPPTAQERAAQRKGEPTACEQGVTTEQW